MQATHFELSLHDKQTVEESTIAGKSWIMWSIADGIGFSRAHAIRRTDTAANSEKRGV